MKLIMIALLTLTGCQTTTRDADAFCFRGVVFIQTASGLSWLPDLMGRPVGCVDYFNEAIEVPDLVPENPK